MYCSHHFTEPIDPSWLLCRTGRRIAIAILKRHVARLRAGPLALRELARNALRETIGALNFKSRVSALQLTTELTEFVVLRAPHSFSSTFYSSPSV